MAMIAVNGSLDVALRKFKTMCSKEGTLRKAREKEYYVTPGEKKKLKSEAARKKKKKKTEIS